MDVPSKLNVIRKATTLVRVRSTLLLIMCVYFQLYKKGRRPRVSMEGVFHSSLILLFFFGGKFVNFENMMESV
jgi:hypothetical protein